MRILSLLLASLLSLDLYAADRRTPSPDLGKMTGEEAVAFYLALDAVIWGYPSVKFEQLMRGRAAPDAEEKTGNPRALVNQFALVRHLRGPEFKQVATPNNDTLYAQAYTDVSREPMVMSVPAVEPDRYYTMQLWDPNGDTFAYVGSRTTGTGPGDYALVGPGWVGQLPAGVERIDSAYNSFVIWGRIGVEGPDDVVNANRIQDGLRLVPLSQYGKSSEQATPDSAFSEQRVAFHNPDQVPEDLLFYVELARSLKYTPPKAQDAVVVQSLAEIGFSDDNTRFDYASLSSAKVSGLRKALQYGEYLMDVNAATTGESLNGWRWSRRSGILGNDYLFRAAWAKWYTGGNAPDEAIYMDGRNDNLGEPFNGSKRYRIKFADGQLPPVKAFWSISMYDLASGAFIANPIDRYSVGTYTPGLTKNSDGSLELYIQQSEPDTAMGKANWLPSPEGRFYMNMRLYVPDGSLRNGTWVPPQVTVVD